MDAAPMTLSALIHAHQDSTGDSYGDIARRAGLSKAKVGQLAIATQPHMPRIDTLEKLARGLTVPLHIIQRAAMASAGITPPDDDAITESDLLAAKIARLSPRDLVIVTRLIDSLLGEEEANG